MLKIAKSHKLQNKHTFAEKISNHILNRNLLGYKSEHHIYFDESEFNSILNQNQISAPNWLNVKFNQNDLIQLVSHPSHQFN
jgi:hypothetical protein